MPEMNHLFVYGTLRSDAASPWSQFLFGASTLVGFARARGVLYQLDGYPGMKAVAGSDSWVTGEVYRLEDPSISLPVLDAYEGDEFERKPIGAQLQDGSEIEAWAYFYIPDASEQARIDSGDYLS
jgi:gamma-glutamylcyclotransferase (GGCT)/AIG2-like uncharacterized protein YtfP